MKKVLFILAAVLATPSISYTQASEVVNCQEVITYRVKAVRNPNAGVKVTCNLTVTWDGSECYVIARDGKAFSNPVRASYSTTYKGYPYVVSFQNQTWYFSL